MIMDFIELAAECAPDVHVTTLASIVQHESSVNPYAIGMNSKDVFLPRQPRNKTEAIAVAEWLRANGHDFDAGLGQVNIRNIEKLGMSIPDLFDPCTNLRGAATILTDCYKRALIQHEAGQPALNAALSCYNTGNFSTGFYNGYVMKVAKNAAVQVPALITMEEGRPKHTVQASYLPKTITKNDFKQAKSREELSDAFGNKKNDAFFESVTKKTVFTLTEKEA